MELNPGAMEVYLNAVGPEGYRELLLDCSFQILPSLNLNFEFFKISLVLKISSHKTFLTRRVFQMETFIENQIRVTDGSNAI